MRLLSKFNHRLAGALQTLLIIVFSILVVVVIWGVGSRYLLGDQASWTEELARLLMVWLALLGAALVCREDRHLGLDVVVCSWTPDAQRLGQLFVYFLIFLFAAGIMAGGGWELVRQRFASGQTLPALGVSKAWFYMALPASGLLTSIFMVESFWATLRPEAAADGSDASEESEASP